MKSFYWNTIGEGKINVILLSGWGLHSKIWFFIIKKFQLFFKFYLIDLPGFGKNRMLHPMKIDCIIKILYYYMPKNSIWMGWSMGGLIASKFALSYPKETLAVISVASSPCFIEKKDWPGIKKDIAERFYLDLKKDYYKTINDFLNLQTINSNPYVQDLIILKKILFSEMKPSISFLKNGLEIISSIDLRSDIVFLKVPLLRIYGGLDNLVPKNIAKILDKKWPKTNSIIIKKAAHIPFVSHKKEFCFILWNFLNSF